MNMEELNEKKRWLLVGKEIGEAIQRRGALADQRRIMFMLAPFKEAAGQNTDLRSTILRLKPLAF